MRTDSIDTDDRSDEVAPNVARPDHPLVPDRLAIAARTLPVVLGSAAIFGLAGGALILASTSGGKRRQWSSPLSVTRYRGGDNPGWG